MRSSVIVGAAGVAVIAGAVGCEARAYGYNSYGYDKFKDHSYGEKHISTPASVAASMYVGVSKVIVNDAYSIGSYGENFFGNGTDLPASLNNPLALADYQCTCTCDLQDSVVGCYSFYVNNQGVPSNWGPSSISTLTDSGVIFPNFGGSGMRYPFDSVISSISAFQSPVLSVYTPRAHDDTYKWIGTQSLLNTQSVCLTSPEVFPFSGDCPNNEVGVIQSRYRGMIAPHNPGWEMKNQLEPTSTAFFDNSSAMAYQVVQAPRYPTSNVVKLGDVTCKAPTAVLQTCVDICEAAVQLDVLKTNQLASTCNVKPTRNVLEKFGA